MVTLSTLAKLEGHVVEVAGVNDFSSLGCGSFLSLVAGHEVLLSELSGGVLGSPACAGDGDVRKGKILSIIDQLGHHIRDDEVS